MEWSASCLNLVKKERETLKSKSLSLLKQFEEEEVSTINRDLGMRLSNVKNLLRKYPFYVLLYSIEDMMEKMRFALGVDAWPSSEYLIHKALIRTLKALDAEESSIMDKSSLLLRERE